jgi:DNA replication protein DnaC
MLTEQTMEKLKGLRLDVFAAAWAEQQKNPEHVNLSFDERLGLLVDAECLQRENRRLDRLLREAKLRLGQACIENVDYGPKRELDKTMVRQLATCRWVNEHHAIVISGATGTGKTYLACAFAQQACRHGHSALYRRASRLFDELALARADGTYARVLAKIARIDVLVIDDWGLTQPREPEKHDLLEILEDRSGNRATIMTSQVDPKHWHQLLGEPTLADAIVDRIINRAHKIALKGPSKRKDATTTT